MIETTLHTDAANVYTHFAHELAGHEFVNHNVGEYVRKRVSTNKAENYFSQLKRSTDGTHHHVSVEHLPRYLAEFDFRYSTCEETDTERFGRLVGRIGGKRISYRPVKKNN